MRSPAFVGGMPDYAPIARPPEVVRVGVTAVHRCPPDVVRQIWARPSLVCCHIQPTLGFKKSRPEASCRNGAVLRSVQTRPPLVERQRRPFAIAHAKLPPSDWIVGNQF